jgi:hypothetical protein
MGKIKALGRTDEDSLTDASRILVGRSDGGYCNAHSPHMYQSSVRAVILCRACKCGRRQGIVMWHNLMRIISTARVSCPTVNHRPGIHSGAPEWPSTSQGHIDGSGSLPRTSLFNPLFCWATFNNNCREGIDPLAAIAGITSLRLHGCTRAVGFQCKCEHSQHSTATSSIQDVYLSEEMIPELSVLSFLGCSFFLEPRDGRSIGYLPTPYCTRRDQATRNGLSFFRPHSLLRSGCDYTSSH